ncbi:MAG: TetR/AcrR family transcriptional regulator [Sphingomonadales bacterium]|nr:TetR/AcrR family transcriptional regulator [Sphingomonadales bacterium]
MPRTATSRQKHVAPPAVQRPRPRRLTDSAGQATDRRSQIVEAAAVLFAEFGYEATSVRQIADSVSILSGSLYHHFTTKEEMLHALLQPRIAAMDADNRRLAALPADAERRLIASVVMRFRQYVDQWAFHTILLQEGRFFRRQEEFAYVVAAKGQAFALQQAILQQGMDSGLFRRDMDTYLMIGTIARMLSGAAAWFRSGDIFSSDKPSRYGLDMVIDFHVDSVLRLVRLPERLGEPVPRGESERLLQDSAG